LKQNKIVREQTFCKCGSKAKGIMKFKYYLLACKECKKKIKYKNKKAYQEDIYNMLSAGKFEPIKLMAVCNICRESMFHNYKFQFCIKCRVVKYEYK